jgi:Fe2+ or Zn2+ uptake regulation protein
MTNHARQVQEQADLDRADAHIAQAEERVAQQRMRIVELARDGHNTKTAEELLRVLKESLATMKAHREQIVEELKRLAQSGKN